MNNERLFVCYVPGLDLRRLDPTSAPYVARLLATYPWMRVRTIPDTETLPTLLTGTYPHTHGVWQVRRRHSNEGAESKLTRQLARLPDLVATTAQGCWHVATRSFDLSTIPPRRRQSFVQTRFKYERSEDGWREPSESVPSIFAILGPQRAHYVFTHRLSDADRLLAKLPSNDYSLEFLEYHGFDVTQRWNLDRPAVMRAALGHVDRLVYGLHAGCQRAGIRFLLLSDHGQEQVRHTIDLLADLEALGLSDSEYAYYLQVPSVRFWFRTERAEWRIRAMLESMPHVSVCSYRDLHQFGVKFEDGRCGELYAFADPGYVFFPHDFYQPVANLFLGLRDPQQRPRVRNPVHRGCHGYLPQHASEVGFVLLASGDRQAPRATVELIDIAPTILALAGEPVPGSMHGSNVFPAS